MTYRITNQAGQLVTIALPVFFLIVTILVFAFHGTVDAVKDEQENNGKDVTRIEEAFLGLNP